MAETVCISPEVRQLLCANDKRNAEMYAPFNPYSGEGSVGRRTRVEIPDFPVPVQFLPDDMMREPLVRQIVGAGTLKDFVLQIEEEAVQDFPEGQCPEFDYDTDRLKVIKQFIRIRCRYDFPFWAALFVMIKNKEGGEDVLFRLTYPQRKFVRRLEKYRLAGKPIRLVLLKARQWGGSTTSQLYMAWLQLVQRKGLNSLIIAHQGSGSDEILDMFNTMIRDYPVEMLYEMGGQYEAETPKWVNVGKTGSIHRVPQRACKVKVGTAERPDSCRGGSYNLVHLSEVGIWKTTKGKRPEDIVRSATSGIPYEPLTMIVYESTANGSGNFFHGEYTAAKEGKSQFESMFVPWFDIQLYWLPFASDDEKADFAIWLYDNRDGKGVPDDRTEPGWYLWSLWQKGASLEGIHWYVMERRKFHEHGMMAAEYPSDDIEAFVHSGERVFDAYHIEKFRPSCRPPKAVGEVYADGDEGRAALRNIRFADDAQGRLWVWEFPEIDAKERILNRYLTVVDVGGRGDKADWSVITVFDRLFMMEGGRPVVVAQWRGHIDMDLLAWKAAQVAAWYDDSLLVIESNTLETHDKDRWVEPEQGSFILAQIKEYYENLYARRQTPEAIREGLPAMLGFQTNRSTKMMVISCLVKAIREHSYIERDKRCLDEYISYERKQNGSYGAIEGEHDDMLMTRAIGLQICFYEMELPVIVPRVGAYRCRIRRPVSEATIT